MGMMVINLPDGDFPSNADWQIKSTEREGNDYPILCVVSLKDILTFHESGPRGFFTYFR
jgi:hypothetical protein